MHNSFPLWTFPLWGLNAPCTGDRGPDRGREGKGQCLSPVPGQTGPGARLAPELHTLFTKRRALCWLLGDSGLHPQGVGLWSPSLWRLEAGFPNTEADPRAEKIPRRLPPFMSPLS